MRKYSVVIPVYNRPDELSELLESLTHQRYKNFEVLVVDDGSRQRADEVAAAFAAKLSIRYFYKPNTGQGFSRNYGFERATGDYFVVYDSDTIVPPQYFQELDNALSHNWLDAFGGPDAAHSSFSDLQRAISYSMTSIFTTGGIRGNKKNAGGAFQPRGFNMGLSRAVFEATGGFAKRDAGEDVELSARLAQLHYKVGLIETCFVYHKRRGTFGQFFWQIVQFGRTRVDLQRQFGTPLKLVHALPAVFALGCVSVPFWYFVSSALFKFSLVFLSLFSLAIFVDATRLTKNVRVGALSVAAAFVQLTAYGFGFIGALFGRTPKTL